MPVLELSHIILQNLDVAWTFFLIVTRFTALFYALPGIGEGARGVTIRMPAILLLSFASLNPEMYATLPVDVAEMLLSFASELIFGLMLGYIPLLIVAGVQTAAQLSSTSMGLGASQLMDPTSGATVSDLSRILGDLSIVLFLLIDGHHVIIQAASGFGGTVSAGSFHMGKFSLELIINRTADMFTIAVMLSAPVIVALLLTQFVMGLISKVVPTVNIFIVSFPLTTGIGLILTVVAMPDMFIYIQKQITGIENSMLEIAKDTAPQP